ncbi:gamma-glutamyl-gamma-aminobutyrate hydrolase family protein [Clostridium sp. YIM B02515]|uniref:Gamma-glutamyl-gamma-aminobutyrate hydrolase family protein n=1 Tax=Clostridium rhizosphaerae TaxID=2803861 RepID=A0ABS1TGG2_9CLOT|nr:gamma-glutamyl-gamma-aminobutyrate hydrolase family protein [Clostridium rhizosphaerae]MBL4938474.1 gamma-glutamyl-gamma-aminobutyrate hydrolase family protein [Clostridium rhizosphaerae]
MKKPVIGILGNLLLIENDIFAGSERSYVNNDYIKAVHMAGGVPVIIPPLLDNEIIDKQISILDGIIISGGYDVNPLLYGDEPRENLGFIHPLVDDFTIKAIKAAVGLNKPILGICKGAQILNVTFGGTLYQDLSYMPGCFVKHSQNAKPDVATHIIEVEKGSKLYEITEGNTYVNSFHHQVLKDIAKDFKVTARAKDGAVEAIEMEDKAFVMAVQWHPEMMAATNEIMRRLFERLIKESSKTL